MGSSAPASLKFNPATIRIGIIGLGYVGLPLAVEFGKKYRTIGFDIKQSRIDELNAGHERTREVDTGKNTQDSNSTSTSTPAIPPNASTPATGNTASPPSKRLPPAPPPKPPTSSISSTRASSPPALTG